MKLSVSFLGAVVFMIALGSPAGAEPDETNEVLPWETYSISVGYMFTTLGSRIRLGSGLGVDIDVEDALSLDSNLSVVRLEGMYRWGRHRMDLGWVAFHRSASRISQKDIIVEVEEGDNIVIEAGTQVKSRLNLDLLMLSYNYSILLDERLDLALGLGLYIAPLDAELNAQGFAQAEGRQSFTAPLPALSLRLDLAMTPKWFLRFKSQLFYLEYQSFKGSIFDNLVTLEYKPWKHFGFGLGYNQFRIDIEGDGEDYPNIDLKGYIGFQYSGIFLYAKAYF